MDASNPGATRAEPELATVPARITAVVAGRQVPMEELPAFFDRSFGLLAETLGQQGVAPESAAFALYRGAPSATVDVEVGFVTPRAIEPAGEVVPGELPAGRVARVVHHGSYDGLADAWSRLLAWIGEQGLTHDLPFWEVYLTEPSPDMDPADLRTELNWTVTG